METIKLKMDKGGAVGAVFLYFKKAFESANNNLLYM